MVTSVTVVYATSINIAFSVITTRGAVISSSTRVEDGYWSSLNLNINDYLTDVLVETLQTVGANSIFSKQCHSTVLDKH